MLSLDDWLYRVGFMSGNPFALKWADDERERFQEYFVERPAYHAVLDAGAPHSVILHAERGAGKSATRLMFEAACATAPAPRALLVQLFDWMPLAEATGGGAVTARDLLRELLRLYVVALADTLAAPKAGLGAPELSADEAGALRWICARHGEYLLPGQRAVLMRAGWLSDAGEHDRYSLVALPVLRVLELLARITRGLGHPACYVVIDGVDELFETAHSWEAGAELLAPLLGNTRLLEVPHLAFKCFVPTGVVNVLRSRGQLREDRMACTELVWGRDDLAQLLRGRLLAYSDGRIESLAMCAEADAADVDEALCSAAETPRRMLALGEQLVQLAAREASDARLLLRATQLARVLTRQASVVAAPPVARAEASPPTSTPPLLRLSSDGSLWRGNQQIEAARRLSPLQRRLLEYLYKHSGVICATDKLIEETWVGRDPPNDRDSLRRLVERLVEIIEPDPQSPVYIERIYGGYYVLRHTTHE